MSEPGRPRRQDRELKFCTECGHSVDLRIPEGDTLPRHVCPSCETIHYQNPRMVVGCVPEIDGRILLCRRAIEPRYGFWTTPAGFLENGETLEDGAARESEEEALARVEIGSLLAVVNVLRARQVHIMFRARLLNEDFGAGDESLEVKLVEERDIPWEDIAFPSIEFALRRYFEDDGEGVHVTDLSDWRSWSRLRLG